MALYGRSRVVYRENFIHAHSARDFFGHGEHVSGIIAGNGADSTCSNCDRTFRGIAPGVNLIDLRVLDSNGTGADSFVIEAIQRAIELKDVYNIRVINISLGHPVFESYTTDPLCQAAELAWRAGIVVVAAAGNDGRDNSFDNNGYGTIYSPGNDPYVITVGAMKTVGTPQRTDDLIASYSSKGPTPIDHVLKPDIVAPGNRVVSLMAPHGSLQRDYPSNLVPLSYFRKDVLSGDVHELIHVERHQNGHAGGQRCRGLAPPSPSRTHTRPSESPPDVDCLQNVPEIQRGH